MVGIGRSGKVRPPPKLDQHPQHAQRPVPRRLAMAGDGAEQ